MSHHDRGFEREIVSATVLSQCSCRSVQCSVISSGSWRFHPPHPSYTSYVSSPRRALARSQYVAFRVHANAGTVQYSPEYSTTGFLHTAWSRSPSVVSLLSLSLDAGYSDCGGLSSPSCCCLGHAIDHRLIFSFVIYIFVIYIFVIYMSRCCCDDYRSVRRARLLGGAVYGDASYSITPIRICTLSGGASRDKAQWT
jgi:hypothetical protein